MLIILSPTLAGNKGVELRTGEADKPMESRNVSAEIGGVAWLKRAGKFDIEDCATTGSDVEESGGGARAAVRYKAQARAYSARLASSSTAGADREIAEVNSASRWSQAALRSARDTEEKRDDDDI